MLDKELAAAGSAHGADLKHLLDKALASNRKLEQKVEVLEEEVKLRRAGAEADKKEVARARRELGDKQDHPLVSVILDFEADMFLPTFFKHGPTSGLVAARALRTRVRENLPADVDPEKAVVQVTVLLNTARKQELVYDMLAEGVIRTPADLDAFIISFNLAHPLLLLITTSCPPPTHLTRLRALAALATRHPHARLVLLGHWALDPRLFAELAPQSAVPSQAGKVSPLPEHVAFLPPYRGQWLAPELTAKGPRFASLKGVVRAEVGMRRGRGSWGPARVNPSVPPWAQTPAICLAHHLRPLGCPHEACPSCHAYQLSPAQTAALGQQVSSTPCPAIRRGLSCKEGKECVFLHPPEFESVWREPAAAERATPHGQHTQFSASSPAATPASQVASAPAPAPPPASPTLPLQQTSPVEADLLRFPNFSRKPSALAAARAARAKNSSPPIIVPPRPAAAVPASVADGSHVPVREHVKSKDGDGWVEDGEGYELDEGLWDGTGEGADAAGLEWEEGRGEWRGKEAGHGLEGEFEVDQQGRVRMREMEL